MPGFCKSESLEEIRKNGHVLTPGRYVGAEDLEDDGEPFEEKMRRLITELHDQIVKDHELDAIIESNLKRLNYGE